MVSLNKITLNVGSTVTYLVNGDHHTEVLSQETEVEIEEGLWEREYVIKWPTSETGLAIAHDAVDPRTAEQWSIEHFEDLMKGLN